MLTIFKRASEPDTDPQDGTLEELDSEMQAEPKKRGLFSRRQKKTEGPAEPDLAHPWTNGQYLKSVGATALIWTLAGSGVLSLGLDLVRDESGPAPTSVEVQDPADSQRVGEYGAAFISRYLSAGQGQEDQITAMLADGVKAQLQLPSTPRAIGAVTPGPAVEADGGTWIVTVAVDEAPADGQQPVRRYWQLPVQLDDNGHMAVTALPSLVTAPSSSGITVTPGSELNDPDVTAAVDAFMKAYLAGQGEVAPLTSPGSALTAIEPAPYTDASVSAIRTSQEMPETPASGDQVRTEVSVTATAADGSSTQMSYTLDLRYRDRWEVAAINPTEAAPTPEGEQS